LQPLTNQPDTINGKPKLVSSLPPDFPELESIVADFANRLDEKLVEFQAALDCQDFGQLAKLAHWLKGTGGTIGFAVLTEEAAHLEQIVLDRPEERIDEISEAIETLMQLEQRISTVETSSAEDSPSHAGKLLAKSLEEKENHA